MSYSNPQRPRRMAYAGARRDGESLPTTSQGRQSAHDPSSLPEEEPTQRRCGYTMIRPKEEKRVKLLETATKESEKAEARKQKRRSISVRERPQAVGGLRSHQDVIRQKQRQTNISPATQALQRKAKREQWAQEKKDKEERENQEKKYKARVQAEKNERQERQTATRQREEARMHWNARFGNS